ncbi:uncharacterized protein HMPREF1541_10183 [Cyphellophora europaea CBS 101466]|uniref:BTB domain-containing protein n=1 Tax=Cyphellophora europaea (strain CBS 101466) TaxID=1220924 RepID=W2S912_CYPE1|nr:uncharacterized protein HMPREF1541_10183 [Cyphellophora europaea CBS 101466]ETN44513.1 hypothetical protein HMPREF1541_10183 [Cyphellophora europaea CBS 101466]
MPIRHNVNQQNRPALQHIDESATVPESPQDALTIKLDGTSGVYRISKDLLIRKSAFFRTMLGGIWKESESSVITLHDDNPQALEFVLQLLQSKHQVPASYFSPNSDVAKRQFIALHACQIADKYDIPEVSGQMIDFLLNEAFILARQPNPASFIIEHHCDVARGAFGGHYPDKILNEVFNYYVYRLDHRGKHDSSKALLTHMAQDNPHVLVEMIMSDLRSSPV